MKEESIISKLWAYLKRHWFKLSLLVLILIAVFRRDLSVSLKVGATPNDAPKKETKDTKITSDETKNAQEETPLSIGDWFDFSKKETAEMPEIEAAVKIEYLKRFAKVAIAERQKYKVPSSIVLANALRQSFAGKRDLTIKANNHFALPCTYDWQGGTAKLGGECYRMYENAWLSFRDHSIFVTSGKFAELLRFGETDYKSWARGLEQLGYPSVGKDFAEELISIIETYRLYRLDTL